jgi:hypothetical protein
MGMDIYGRKPENPTGEYVRYSVWTWHPVADYVLETAPEALIRKCEHWHSNDGDGLNGEDSRALAAFLTEEINSGRAEAYAEMRSATLESLPDVVCFACNGTGKLGLELCHVCRGTGKGRPSETMYPLDLEQIIRFRDFLQVCGGFNIH